MYLVSFGLFGQSQYCQCQIFQTLNRFEINRHSIQYRFDHLLRPICLLRDSVEYPHEAPESKHLAFIPHVPFWPRKYLSRTRTKFLRSPRNPFFPRSMRSGYVSWLFLPHRHVVQTIRSPTSLLLLLQ